VFGELVARRAILIEYLAEQAGKDPLEDRYKVGYITAINDLVQVKVEDVAN
jgi:hypothetical protein